MKPIIFCGNHIINLFNNPVGIGEHPQLEEMDKLITKMVDANDKLQLLNLN